MERKQPPGERCPMHAIPRNRFPLFAAVALSAVIVVGFARTYYLKFMFGQPPLTLAAHVHGLVASLWLVLHIVQARLVAMHRVDLHRKLGVFAACVGLVLAVQALHLGIAGVAAGHAPPGRNPLQFLSVPIGTTSMFTLFLVGALALRKKREWHKRLMFLATLALIVPAMGRFDSMLMPLGMPRGLLATWCSAAFVAWACWNDWRKRGAVHPAYVYGGALLIVSLPMRRWIGMQDWWIPIANSIIGGF
jgi:hypothetical protein